MPAVPRIYLDHNATSPLRPAARAAMLAALEAPANPSSIHAEGRAARALVERARAAIAALCGARAAHVVFTSGATEAAALALAPALAGGPGARLLAFAGEHPCMRAGGRFAPGATTILPATADGLIDLAALQSALAAEAGRPTMLALQLANNETGAIQPVAEAAGLARAAGAVIVCDAVQAAGRMAIDIAALGVDWLILSSHKLGGPAGVGALVCARPFPAEAALLRGGGQERGARAGTENVAAIAGFGAAAQAAGAARAAEETRLAALRDAIEVGVAAIPGAAIFSAGAPRLCNTLCFAVAGLEAETLGMALDLAGVAVSPGSACSSGKVGASPMIAAMGAPPELARGALRASLGWSSTGDDATRFIEIFARVAGNMLARRTKSAA